MRSLPALLALSFIFSGCDGTDGSSGRPEELIDADFDGSYANAENPADRDCDDNQPAINPNATEICNGVDDDCNQIVDDNAEGALEWFPDRDGDGFGAPLRSETVTACFRPQGYSANPRDCNDSDPLIFFGAQERCNGIDDDCDLLEDEGIPLAEDWYADRDRDGFGGGEPVGSGCATDPSWVLSNDDCNDVLDSVNPNAPEICDGIDNDCDNQIDDDDDDIEGARRWYADEDEDGFGNVLSSQLRCERPDGHVTNSLDCNDANPDQNPTTTWYVDDDRDGYGRRGEVWPYEQCWQPIGYSIFNNDCDDTNGLVHLFTEWHPDADRDGYGGPEVVGFGCDSQEGWVLNADDCNDRDDAFSPGVDELCNGRDDDCDDLIDDDDPDVINRPTRFVDADGDGYGTPLGSFESCVEPPNTSSNDQDCNDAQALLNPETIWYRDADRDTFGDPTNPYPTPQCEFIPGYMPNTLDCDDSDPLLHDATEWYPDADRDGLGVGITPTVFGCPTGNRQALESGDCDDNDPTNNTGGCFGPQLGVVEVSIIGDADTLGVAVLGDCFTQPEVLDISLGDEDANTTISGAFIIGEGSQCGIRMFNVVGDPSGDGLSSLELRVCGVLIESFEIVEGVVEFAPFDVTACSGCFDPNAQNYDPTVLVPQNEDACIY